MSSTKFAMIMTVILGLSGIVSGVYGLHKNRESLTCLLDNGQGWEGPGTDRCYALSGIVSSKSIKNSPKWSGVHIENSPKWSGVHIENSLGANGKEIITHHSSVEEGCVNIHLRVSNVEVSCEGGVTTINPRGAWTRVEDR